MDSFFSSRPEIILIVLQSCDDFEQLLDLVLACRYIHSVWMANTTTIIWKVGLRCISAFDDALMAVRATAIVKEAHVAGVLPPKTFPIKALGGATRKPTLEELKKILDLHHLVRCIQHMHFHWRLNSSIWTHDGQVLEALPSSPIELRTWKERFYRSMYRVVLSGAVLARAYWEPFSGSNANPEAPNGFFGTYSADSEDVDGEDAEDAEYVQRPLLLRSGLDYLSRFAVYKLNSDGQAEFSELAEWLVEQGKSRARRMEDGIVGCEDWDRETLGAQWGVMQLYVAQEHFLAKIGQPAWGHTIDEKVVRTVEVCLFGVWRVEEIVMPKCVEDSEKTYLFARPVPSHQNGDGEEKGGGVGDGENTRVPSRNLWNLTKRHIYIPELLEYLYYRSGLPNHVDGYPAPPPPLQFFKYTLRKHLNLIFDEQAFDESWAERTCENAQERVATFDNNKVCKDGSGRTNNTSEFGGRTLTKWREMEMTCEPFY